MALTFADYPIAPGDGWVNLAAASGYATLSGAPVALQNKVQGARLLVQFNESGTAPDGSTYDGASLNFGAEASGRSGSIWIRAIGANVVVGARVLDQASPAQVQGNNASGAADSGNPVKVGGKYSSTLPTLADGQRGDLQLDSRGNLNVSVHGVTLASSDGVSNANIINFQSYVTQSGGNAPLQVAGTYFNGTTWDRARGDISGLYTAGSVFQTESATPLAANATINGGTRINGGSDTVGGIGSRFNFFVAEAMSDQALSLVVQKSSNGGVTWRNVSSLSVAANQTGSIKVPISAGAYRGVILNGATAQGTLLFTTAYTTA